MKKDLHLLVSSLVDSGNKEPKYSYPVKYQKKLFQLYIKDQRLNYHLYNENSCD
jgi:hypothetical protein